MSRSVDATYDKFRKKSRDMSTDQLEEAVENLEWYDGTWDGTSDELDAKRRAYQEELDDRE